MPDNPPPPTLGQFAAYQRERKYLQAWGKRLPSPAPPVPTGSAGEGPVAYSSCQGT
jgi:hypothetical protein